MRVINYNPFSLRNHERLSRTVLVQKFQMSPEILLRFASVRSRAGHAGLGQRGDGHASRNHMQKGD